MTARHHAGSPVVGSEIVEHPYVLGRQRKVGQRLGELAQRHIDVPGSAVVGAGANAGGAAIGQHAVGSQDSPRQVQDHGVFNQGRGSLALVQQIPQPLRALVVEQGRQVQEELLHLARLNRPRGVELGGPRMANAPHEACLFLGADRVVGRQKGFNGFVVRHWGSVAGIEGRGAFGGQSSVDLVPQRCEALPVQHSGQDRIAVLLQVVEGGAMLRFVEGEWVHNQFSTVA